MPVAMVSTADDIPSSGIRHVYSNIERQQIRHATVRVPQ
jgi:hypothetical protein